jgi:uncharacterized protein (TIGR02246 family)
MGAADDELKIRSLAAAYTDAVNRRDGAGMAAVYAPDGVLEVAGRPKPIVGREKLEKGFRRLVEEDREFLFQMIHSGVVEVDGDQAQARWWFSELKKPTGQGYELTLGVYEDRAVRLDVGWRFAWRRAGGALRWGLPDSDIAHTPLSAFLPITGLPIAGLTTT